MLIPTTFRSRFGGHYKLHTLRDGIPPAGLQALRLLCASSARQFLVNLQVPTDYWLHLAAGQNMQVQNESLALRELSRQIASGRIRIYPVEKLDPLTNPRTKRVLRKPSGEAFYFEPAARLLIHKPREVKQFFSAAGACEFIESLNPNDDQLQNLAGALNPKSLPQSPGPLPRKKLVEHLAEALLKQELVIVVERPVSKTKDGTELELLEPAPFIRPSDIAPPPLKTWVEVKLVDDTGEPVANEPFILICPKGTEHKGTTDGGGVARIDGMAQGKCYVAFPELDGSGISPG